MNETILYIGAATATFLSLFWWKHDKILARFFEHLTYIVNTDAKGEKGSSERTAQQTSAIWASE